jgi:hypothetical protein
MGATLVDTGGMPLQPPRRQPNAKFREREYLTDGEIARLIAVAGENRHSHRDGTMVLVAYRHGRSHPNFIAVGLARSARSTSRRRNRIRLLLRQVL